MSSKGRAFHRSAISAIIGLSLAMMAGPASSQAPSEPRNDQGEQIVVTGTRLSAEEVRRQANDFVRKIGVAEGGKPVARWTDGICLHVLGLADRYAAKVVSSVHAAARAANVPIAKGKCDTNILISFSSDAAAEVRMMAMRAPGTLEQVPLADRADLRMGNAPIRWWYATRERTTEGRGDFGSAPGWVGGAEGGGSPLPGGLPTYGQYSSSVISTQMVRVLKAATIVIDMKAVEGQALDTVAAYAALVALAEIRRSDPPPPGSILAMFAGEPAPIGLTPRDETFLRSLYRLPLDRLGRKHRSLLVRDLVSAEKRP